MKPEDQILKRINHFEPSYLKRYESEVVVIKYGGNAMTDSRSQQEVAEQIAILKSAGVKPVVVHGGGPVIGALFKVSGIESKFIDGHRITHKESMEVVEQALSGKVNGLLVNRLNRLNANAVGLSGKDGRMVTAVKRLYRRETENGSEDVDLGFVGDVHRVDTKLIDLLLKSDYLPVISPVSAGEDGEDYNINADMFAGHIAGAMKAKAFIAITNVDGLMEDPDKPETKIQSISPEDVKALFGTVIKGGMIPKIEACLIAIDKGVEASHIVNGSTKNSILNQLFSEIKAGTTIH